MSTKSVYLAIQLDPPNGGRDRIVYASMDRESVLMYAAAHMVGMTHYVQEVHLGVDYHERGVRTPTNGTL